MQRNEGISTASMLTGAAIAVGSITLFQLVGFLLEKDRIPKLSDEGQNLIMSELRAPVPQASSPNSSVSSTSSIEVRERFSSRKRRPRSKQRAGKAPVIRIALTGGPCGGKSSVLNYIVKRLEERSFQVFVAPEMPTLMQSSCMCPFPWVPNATPAEVRHQLVWEANKMQLQLDLEDSLMEVAHSSGKPTVILCDRGVPDSAAYVDVNQFQAILDDRDWTLDRLMNRYSMVIHLESAAIDTHVYETMSGNNAARLETKEQAREQDQKTQAAWASHPNVKMIRNLDCRSPPNEINPGRDFEMKKKLTVEAVFHHLGLGNTVFHRRVFLLTGHAQSKLFNEAQVRTDVFYIDSTFLRDYESADGVERDRVIERRGRLGAGWTYTVSKAVKCAVTGQDDKIKLETRISGRQYAELLDQKDPNRVTVHKKRTVFVCHIPEVGRDVTHRVDEILKVEEPNMHSTNNSEEPEPVDTVTGLELLTVDLREDQEYLPPAFIRHLVDHEVAGTEHSEYTLASLSARLSRAHSSVSVDA